jgi:hypothetical protein
MDLELEEKYKRFIKEVDAQFSRVIDICDKSFIQEDRIVANKMLFETSGVVDSRRSNQSDDQTSVWRSKFMKNDLMKYKFNETPMMGSAIKVYADSALSQQLCSGKLICQNRNFVLAVADRFFYIKPHDSDVFTKIEILFPQKITDGPIEFEEIYVSDYFQNDYIILFKKNVRISIFLVLNIDGNIAIKRCPITINQVAAKNFIWRQSKLFFQSHNEIQQLEFRRSSGDFANDFMTDFFTYSKSLSLDKTFTCFDVSCVQDLFYVLHNDCISVFTNSNFPVITFKPSLDINDYILSIKSCRSRLRVNEALDDGPKDRHRYPDYIIAMTNKRKLLVFDINRMKIKNEETYKIDELDLENLFSLQNVPNGFREFNISQNSEILWLKSLDSCSMLFLKINPWYTNCLSTSELSLNVDQDRSLLPNVSQPENLSQNTLLGQANIEVSDKEASIEEVQSPNLGFFEFATCQLLPENSLAVTLSFTENGNGNNKRAVRGNIEEIKLHILDRDLIFTQFNLKVGILEFYKSNKSDLSNANQIQCISTENKSPSIIQGANQRMMDRNNISHKSSDISMPALNPVSNDYKRENESFKQKAQRIDQTQNIHSIKTIYTPESNFLIKDGYPGGKIPLLLLNEQLRTSDDEKSKIDDTLKEAKRTQDIINDRIDAFIKKFTPAPFSSPDSFEFPEVNSKIIKGDSLRQQKEIISNNFHSKKIEKDEKCSDIVTQPNLKMNSRENIDKILFPGKEVPHHNIISEQSLNYQPPFSNQNKGDFAQSLGHLLNSFQENLFGIVSQFVAEYKSSITRETNITIQNLLDKGNIKCENQVTKVLESVIGVQITKHFQNLSAKFREASQKVYQQLYQKLPSPERDYGLLTEAFNEAFRSHIKSAENISEFVESSRNLLLVNITHLNKIVLTEEELSEIKVNIQIIHDDQKSIKENLSKLGHRILALEIKNPAFSFTQNYKNGSSEIPECDIPGQNPHFLSSKAKDNAPEGFTQKITNHQFSGNFIPVDICDERVIKNVNTSWNSVHKNNLSVKRLTNMQDQGTNFTPNEPTAKECQYFVKKDQAGP